MAEESNIELILLTPNLGNPIILDAQNRKKKNYSFRSLISSNLDRFKVFNECLTNTCKLIPLFEVKWKKKQERKSERFKFWKKKPHRKESSKLNVLRGTPVELKISQIDKFNPSYSEFIDLDAYKNKGIISGEFFQVEFTFSLTKEVRRYLKSHKFIMYDLAFNTNYGEERINYHSVVVSRNRWEDFTFVQATDLHIADRNDNIYEIVKNWLSGFRTKNFADFAKFSLEGFSFLKNTIVKFFNPTETEIDPPSVRVEPLSRRLINSNNNLRKFIRMMNKKVLQNELDFIILTGDLIDYSTLSNLHADFKNYSNFEYMNTNWKVLKEILLNFPQKKKRGMRRGAEILCPIYTIPGNHDFRPFHYDIRWGGLYKKIGLNLNEAIALNDKLAANPIGSITRLFMSLKGYLLEFNFKLDYAIKLGKFNFIFLNSGPDSFKNLRDFISGHPSATGITNRQIRYLEYLINNQLKKNDETFLFLHGPPINPQKRISIFDRFILAKSSGGLSSDFKRFKESINFNKQKTRMDVRFNMKYGTISTNWEKLLNFCKDYCLVTFSGHTHEFKEFRLEDPETKKTKVIDAPPFILKKIENPAAVYYDVYSETDTNFKIIKEKAPYVVQTPALGLGGFHNPKLAGSYREIKVKNGNLVSFKVSFINKI